MTLPLVHLRVGEHPSRTLCGTRSLTWTRDPLAVTCPRCETLSDAQPA